MTAQTRAEKAQHNDLDFACVHWWGDRSAPSVTWFGGDPIEVVNHRCLVCRPYTEAEADDLIGVPE